MSLQNYDPSKPKKLIFTYDSLHNNIMALKRQVDKTKQFSEELDVIKSMEDVKNTIFIRPPMKISNNMNHLILCSQKWNKPFKQSKEQMTN